MKTEDVINGIGKSEASPEIQRLLGILGVHEALSIPPDDIEARLSHTKSVPYKASAQPKT